jgi:hypothetical protein
MVQLTNHKDDSQFVINLTSLQLTAPKPLYANHQAYHFETAAALQVTQAEKQEKTKLKAKATREANKAKKQSREITMQAQQPEDAEIEIDDMDSGEEDSSRMQKG